MQTSGKATRITHMGVMKMSVVAAHKESERLIMSQVDEIEELYFIMTNESNMSFTDNFRQDVRGMIRQYGIDTVLESIKDIVNKYGSDGLDKLITFVICKSNPKINKTNYICGIYRNKNRRSYIHQDTKNDIYRFVSLVIDEYGVDCLDYVIEQYKQESSFTNESFWGYVHTWNEQHAVTSARADYPQKIQAATGVCVPDTIGAEQASIEDPDGSVPNVNVVNKKPIAVSLDDNSIDKLVEKINKDRKQDAADGFAQGILKTDALSQPARENEIKNMQEDMMTDLGLAPAEIARIHNRNANKSTIRRESSRIANNQRQRKPRHKKSK